MIDWVNASLTSASMAVDAMTVNATNGLKEKNMPIWKMIVLSCLFGTFQFGMPVVGYFIGTAFKEYIEDAIPWIAFGLLTLLAIKSLVEWIKDFRKIKKEGCQVCKEAETPKKIGPGTAIVQAIATSIDALCIGFVYLYPFKHYFASDNLDFVLIYGFHNRDFVHKPHKPFSLFMHCKF